MKAPPPNIVYLKLWGSKVERLDKLYHLGRLSAVVVDHAEQLVLPLLGAGATLGGQETLGDLQVHGEVYLLGALLDAARQRVVHKSFQVKNK